MIDLSLTCPACGRRADMCFDHGDAWKKRRRAVYPVCPHCRQRIINPGGHAEACTGPGPSSPATADSTLRTGDTPPLKWAQGKVAGVQVELAPDHEIDPTTQVTRTPGIDAICQKVGAGGYAPDCGFPFCDCFVTGGS